jgi:hypothetical protein
VLLEDSAKEALGTHEFGWPPLQPETIARKATGDSPLLETGALRDSIKHNVDANGKESGGRHRSRLCKISRIRHFQNASQAIPRWRFDRERTRDRRRRAGRGQEDFQMTAIFQRWAPTKAEAELLVDMLVAKLTPAKIAKFFHIDVRTLKAFLERLSAAADAPCPEPPPLPPLPREEAPASRILAERLFAGDGPQRD